MDKEMLARIGRIVYGINWQTQLAREANLNPRTIRRYASGDLNISPEVIAILNYQLQQKITEANKGLNEIRTVAYA